MARRDDPDGVLAWVEEKIAATLHLPVKHGEVGAAHLPCGTAAQLSHSASVSAAKMTER